MYCIYRRLGGRVSPRRVQIAQKRIPGPNLTDPQKIRCGPFKYFCQKTNLPPTEPPLITEKYNGCDLCELCALICNKEPK